MGFNQPSFCIRLWCPVCRKLGSVDKDAHEGGPETVSVEVVPWEGRVHSQIIQVPLPAVLCQRKRVWYFILFKRLPDSVIGLWKPKTLNRKHYLKVSKVKKGCHSWHLYPLSFCLKSDWASLLVLLFDEHVFTIYDFIYSSPIVSSSLFRW